MKKTNSCFKEFEKLIGGETISLSADRIGYGKFYTGFSTMNEKMPMFVSSKEKYKKSSELVLDFVKRTNADDDKGSIWNISPITELENFNNVVGIFFGYPLICFQDLLHGHFTITIRMMQLLCVCKIWFGCSSIFQKALKTAKMKRTFIDCLTLQCVAISMRIY